MVFNSAEAEYSTLDGRPVPCTVYAFVVVRCVWSSVQVHIGGSPGVREIFDSFMGDWVSTEHSGRVRRFARYSRPRTEIFGPSRSGGDRVGGAFHMLGRSGVVTLCAMVFQHVTVGQLIIILIQQRQQSSDLFLRRPH